MSKSAPPAQTFSYQALKFAQRDKASSPRFLVFHAAAADIIKWADVDRLEPTNPGAQRPLRELKVKKVAEFFEKDARNTIPTSVVIALDAGAATFTGESDAAGPGEHGIVTIKMTGQDKPGLIIDGQHRVFGTQRFSGELHLNVVAFLGGNDAERAFQFVVINNAATRVKKDHIKALSLTYDKDKLNNRLIDSGGLPLGVADETYDDLKTFDRRPPFKGLIQWPTNRQGYIPATAIEGALAETRDRAALLGIEDLERDVFLAIWIKIRSLRQEVWAPFPQSRLLMKVSIYALTVYVLDSMVAKQRNEDVLVDFTDDNVLDELVERVVDRIPKEFWTTDWKATELDTTSGRQKLLEALQVIDSNVRFSRPWYDRVSLIDPALVADVSKRGGAKKSSTRKSAKKR